MLVNEIREHLTKVLIPFWKGMRDDEYGGYYGWLGYDLKLDKKAVKGCILNSRILWFFSNAYLLLQEASLLDEARHGYEFLKQYCLDQENGGVYWSVTYDGKQEESLKHTYNQAFAIYALASYYNASGEQEALKIAIDLFHLIEQKCIDEFGYLEAFTADFKPMDNEKLSENGVMAEKTMNTLLHVFEAYTSLYDVTKDPKVADRLKWILDLFAQKVYNPVKKRQEVFFDRTWNTLIDLHSFGHDIETAWLIDRGCEILGDHSYIEKMHSITNKLEENVYKLAYDNHSLANESEDGVIDTTRIWWVQAEAMVGYLNAYQKDPGHPEYMQAVKDIWEFIQRYIVDKRVGSEWFWCVDKDGNPILDKPIVEPWKCPYHNGRMCFELIRRLEDA